MCVQRAAKLLYERRCHVGDWWLHADGVELGIAIVLDDFGTGYSSMSYLLSFPFDKIKIDREFVSEVTRRNDCAANWPSQEPKYLNDCRGVETQEQLVLLRAAGCTFAQGYLFGPPCPKSELKFQQAVKIEAKISVGSSS
jgi:EAL domain-containing protein (putative c-di-GMP-specific phosphodiesterase class I)